MSETSTPTRLTQLLAGRSTHTAVQFIRYLVVGGAAYVVDFGTLAVGTRVLGMHYLLAAAAGFLLGLVVNYVIAVRWVFAQRKLSQRWAEQLGYLGIGLVGLGINQAVLWGLVDHGGWDPLVAKLVCGAVVLFWNFAARKLLLF